MSGLGLLFCYHCPLTISTPWFRLTPAPRMRRRPKALPPSLWRSMCNLGLNRGVADRTTWGGMRKPVNAIVRGPVITIHDEDGNVPSGTWWYEPNYQGPIEPLDDTRKLAGMMRFVAAASRLISRSPYCQELEMSLIGYCTALDTRDLESSFLRLWIELERLTESSRSGYRNTLRRAAFLFADQELVRHLLTSLRDFRNAAVHQGVDSTQIETLLYQLKMFVEALSEFHLANRNHFASFQEALAFLDLPIDDTALTSRIRMLQRARRFRSNSP